MRRIAYKTDVLIVGNGIAGLRAACNAATEGAGVIVAGLGEGASPGIMAFNAPLGKDDSPEKFVSDTISCGCSISNRILAEVFARDVVREVAFLEKIGLRFDRNEDGEFDLLHALGATRARLVHHKALTGITGIKVLRDRAQKKGALFHQSVMITNLLQDGGRVVGAVGINTDTGEFLSYLAGAVILATGGCGAMYPVTQYPPDIIGGGYRMAYQAGAELVDMEFMQFEPCIFVYPEEIRGLPIPTTMMMEGAELRNAEGEIFVRAFDEKGNRIHKDGLARIIRKEIDAGRGTKNGGVYYDVSMLPRDRIVVDHSIFYEPALKAGVDLTRERAEVAPAAQTSLGGIRISERCETSVPGLYAAGEVTGGLHGANRMGGSAGAEALVFGARAGLNASRFALENKVLMSPEEADMLIEQAEGAHLERGAGRGGAAGLKEILSCFHETIWAHLNLLKDSDGISKAMISLQKIENTLLSITSTNVDELIDLYKFENMVTSAQIMAAASLARTESRGVHYRTDYPEKNDGEWLKKVMVKRVEGQMKVSIIPTES